MERVQENGKTMVTAFGNKNWLTQKNFLFYEDFSNCPRISAQGIFALALKHDPRKVFAIQRTQNLKSNFWNMFQIYKHVLFQ